MALLERTRLGADILDINEVYHQHVEILEHEVELMHLPQAGSDDNARARSLP